MKITRHDVGSSKLWLGEQVTKSGAKVLHVAESLSETLIGLYRGVMDKNREEMRTDSPKGELVTPKGEDK